MSLPLDAISLFADVNVLVDAFQAQHSDNQPLTFEATGFTCTAAPPAVVMMMIQDQVAVNNQVLRLNTSERTLILMRAILRDDYQWDKGPSDLAAVKIMKLVKGSGGSICRTADVSSVATEFGIKDQEDLHRLAEARHLECTLFLTNDGDYLDLSITNPLIMTPRQFVDRSR